MFDLGGRWPADRVSFYKRHRVRFMKDDTMRVAATTHEIGCEMCFRYKGHVPFEVRTTTTYLNADAALLALIYV